MSVSQSPARGNTQAGGGRTRQTVLATAGGLALAIVLWGGYSHHWPWTWKWTGFRGNTLWDWLNLVVLPLTLVLIPALVKLRDDWQGRHSVVAGTTLTLFVAVVIGGYLGNWTWTGFTGNTLWRWMNLLFLPLLVPTVILPALKPVVTGRVVYLDEHGNPVPDPQPEVTDASEATTDPVPSTPG